MEENRGEQTGSATQEASMAKMQASRLTILAGVFAIIALVFGILGVFGCDFIEFYYHREGYDFSGNYYDYHSIRHFGVFFYEFPKTVTGFNGYHYDIGACQAYSENREFSRDAAWKSAMIFGVAAICLGGLCLGMNLRSLLTQSEGGGMRTLAAIAGAYMICCLFQGLSLLLLNSKLCTDNGIMSQASTYRDQWTWEQPCVMGRGAKRVIVATVLWFFAGLAAFMASQIKKTEIDRTANDAREGLTEPILSPEEEQKAES